MGADAVRVAWVEMIIRPHIVGAKYWTHFRNPFYPRDVMGPCRTPSVFWEWRYSSFPGAYQTKPEIRNRHDLWQPFGHRNGPRLTNWKTVEIRARVSDLIEFVKTTQMFKQMQRLHFMFRPPEGSSGRHSLKAKTWAGEEDETDMILRGPKDEDHFLPEQPYRPWPEEVVRDFKADGVYWNIRIS